MQKQMTPNKSQRRPGYPSPSPVKKVVKKPVYRKQGK